METKMRIILFTLLMSLSAISVWANSKEQVDPKKIKIIKNEHISPILSWHQNDALLSLKSRFINGKKEFYNNLKK